MQQDCTVELEGHRHGVSALLREAILKQSGVTFASALVPHPLVKRIVLRVISPDVKESCVTACDDLTRVLVELSRDV